MKRDWRSERYVKGSLDIDPFRCTTLGNLRSIIVCRELVPKRMSVSNGNNKNHNQVCRAFLYNNISMFIYKYGTWLENNSNNTPYSKKGELGE